MKEMTMRKVFSVIIMLTALLVVGLNTASAQQILITVDSDTTSISPNEKMIHTVIFHFTGKSTKQFNAFCDALRHDCLTLTTGANYLIVVLFPDDPERYKHYVSFRLTSRDGRSGVYHTEDRQ